MASTRRPHDPSGNRTAILDAAEGLFLEHGYEGTSMSSIAKASGITKSLIHHYFGSKDDLWTLLKQTRFAPIIDRQLRVLTEIDGTPDSMRQRLSEFFELLQSSPRPLRLTCWMLLDERHSSDVFDEVRSLCTPRLRQAQADGRLRGDVEPEYILIAFLGLMQSWYINGAFVHSLRVERDAYFDFAWRLFARGVLAEPVATAIDAMDIRCPPMQTARAPKQKPPKNAGEDASLV